jgi:hypothetical protein
MLTTTCLIWPLLEVGRTVTRSPSRPSTRLHTTRFGFTGERAMTTSPGLTFSNLDDRCSNSNMSPETLNVGSMLGPKHWHIGQTRTVRETSWFLQTSVCLFLCSFYINSLKAVRVCWHDWPPTHYFSDGHPNIGGLHVNSGFTEPLLSHGCPHRLTVASEPTFYLQWAGKENWILLSHCHACCLNCCLTIRWEWTHVWHW